MFGINKIHPSATIEDRENFQMHYCGTCKAIGRLHSHKSRIFTNYDTTYLGELLSGLNSQNDWKKSISTFNCMSIPQNKDIPDHLKYTASISVLLADLKTEDNIKDSRFKLNFWRLIKSIFSKDFNSAQKQLKEFNLPLNEIWYLFNEQIKIEQTMLETKSYSLDFFSECTAKITGIVFKTGAYATNQKDQDERLYNIGFQFGKMVYVLDALEDFESDLKHQKFNAVRSVFKSNILDADIKNKIVSELEKYRDGIVSLIHQLPIDQLITEGLSDRLSQNLELRLNNASGDKGCEINTTIKKVNWREKLQLALEYSKNSLTDKSSSSSIWGKIKFGLSFILLFLTLIITPYRVWAQNNSSNSDSTCWGIVIILILVAACGKQAGCCGPAIVQRKDCCGNTVVHKGNSRCNC